MDLEIELVWKRRWSYAKVLYLVNRYVGDALFLHGSASQLWITDGPRFEESCKSALQVQGFLGMTVLWSMNGLIINRISCMWGHDRRIISILVAGLLIHITAGFVFTGLSLSNTSIAITFSPSFRICVPFNAPWIWTFLFFTFGFEVLVFVMAVAQAVRYLRQTRWPAGASAEGNIVRRTWLKQGAVARVLFRDSILFPFIGVTLGMLNILAWAQKLPHPSSQIIIVVAAASSPILGCRLVLNLRDAYYQPFSQEIKQSMFDQEIDDRLEDIIPRFPTVIRAQDSNSGSTSRIAG